MAYNLCLDVQTQMETGAPELFQIMNSTCTCSCALVILNTDPMKLTTHLLSLIESRYGRKWRLRTLMSAICFKLNTIGLSYPHLPATSKGFNHLLGLLVCPVVLAQQTNFWLSLFRANARENCHFRQINTTASHGQIVNENQEKTESLCTRFFVLEPEVPDCNIETSFCHCQWWPFELGMESGFWKTGFNRFLEPDNAKNRFWSPKMPFSASKIWTLPI